MKHGFRPSGPIKPEYAAWVQMRSRCLSPKDRHYKNYGGRRIGICERWNDFRNFLKDVGYKPSPNHSLDRIDNNAGYCPENCRWATPVQQMRNRRVTKLSDQRVAEIKTAIGSQRSIGERFGISQSMVSRVKSGECWSNLTGQESVLANDIGEHPSPLNVGKSGVLP